MPKGFASSHEVRRRFWREVRAGMAVPAAAASVGVSVRTGWIWNGKAGGMPDVDLGEPSGRYLSAAERDEIAVLGATAGVTQAQIARRLGRAASTISRELARNSPTGPNGPQRDRYRGRAAQAKAEARARRPKPAKLAPGPHDPTRGRLRNYVQDKLDAATQPGGQPGRWSPEQISARLRIDFPHDESMRVSPETIYQSLYVQGRGALRRELTVALRTGRAVRRPRRRVDGRRKRSIPPEIMISERPAEVADRAVPGHWEGDLILGRNNASAVCTLVERATRYTLLAHLPRRDHSAEAARDAITAVIMTLPVHLRRSLTWDQGPEMAEHATLRLATGLDVYFCDPHSPWQRGSNENTNGLLRQYLPKSSDLSVHTPQDLAAIAAALNGRPRKTLQWRTPAEALQKLLTSTPPIPVATTG